MLESGHVTEELRHRSSHGREYGCQTIYHGLLRPDMTVPQEVKAGANANINVVAAIDAMHVATQFSSK